MVGALVLNLYFVYHSHRKDFWVFEVYFIIYSFRYFPIIDVILNWSVNVSIWKEVAKNRISEDIALDAPLNEEINIKKRMEHFVGF